MKLESVESDKQSMKEIAAGKAGQQALTARWNTNTMIIAYAVLATVMLLRLEGISTQIVAPVAVCGLAITWMMGLIRSKKLYQRLLEEELHDLQESRQEDKCVTMTKSPLTPKETIILSHIASGYINKEIAFMLGISEQTIKNHVYNIMQKLEVNDRTHAVVMALQHGWLSLDSNVREVEPKSREKAIVE